MFNYFRHPTYQKAEWNKASNGKTFLSLTESFKYSTHQIYGTFPSLPVVIWCPTKHTMEQQYRQFLKHIIPCRTWHQKQFENGGGGLDLSEILTCKK